MKHRTFNVEQSSSSAAGTGNSRDISCSLLHVRLLMICALLFLVFSVSAQAQPSREYQLKAVFLYNFAQFTDWPESAFADTNSPLVIGILGADPFGRTLDETIKDETVRGHPLVIQHYQRAEEAKTCDILFISQSESRHMDEIVKGLKGRPILTVADADGPPSTEVIILFRVENNKVHFRINQDAAKAANLTLSSRLLRVADVPPPGKTP